jgi:signal transduction histidine kinase
LGVVIRSQRRFGGMTRRANLEAAMEELVKSKEIRAVELLDIYGVPIESADGKPLAAGEPIKFDFDRLSLSGPVWTKDSLMVVREVELQPLLDEADRGDGGPWGRPPRGGEGEEGRERRHRRPPGITEEQHQLMIDYFTSSTQKMRTAVAEGKRPEGWDQDRFETVLYLSGMHNLALLLNAESVHEAIVGDAWMRFALILIALVAVLGIGAAWAAAERSFGLEVRLARAQEMNAGLREMNLAAAGLAHETRNPLNIVRGMAQTIAGDQRATEENRGKAQGIIEEVDRVASRLNEFIDYSKPREVKLAPVDVMGLVEEVRSALETDFEDKRISFAADGPEISVQADEPLLRQTLFNLLLNASQSVEPGGRVSVAVIQPNPREVWLEVRDDGPGVPPESREEIFRPYYTTRAEGSGLGLSVVRQIVQAHHWDIAYVDNGAGPSTFRITNLKVG